ncbi:hypothetical protein BHE74_00043488 [Ensete ventricosum]|nr:hypothetical protein BHE74_00043488 [Ensete ventricosum]
MVTGRSYLRSLLRLLLTMPSYSVVASVVLAVRCATCLLPLGKVARHYQISTANEGEKPKHEVHDVNQPRAIQRWNRCKLASVLLSYRSLCPSLCTVPQLYNLQAIICVDVKRLPPRDGMEMALQGEGAKRRRVLYDKIAEKSPSVQCAESERMKDHHRLSSSRCCGELLSTTGLGVRYAAERPKVHRLRCSFVLSVCSLIEERCRIGYEEQSEWYFFSHKDKKYPTGTRTNRATMAGFWKATGRDKAVHDKNKLIGMRKTLVFYKGRAPNGQKTDWIMHEYRLESEENGAPQAS